MITPQDEANQRSNAVRIMALNAMMKSLIATHPDPQALRDAAEFYAEANRSVLLNLAWTEDQIAAFEQAFGQLCHTLPPPSST